MLIYQALEHLDYPVDNYLDMIVAVQTEEDLKHWQFENDVDLSSDFENEVFEFDEDLSWIGAA